MIFTIKIFCISGKEVQARWKNIRDAYSKDCRKHTTDTKSGSEAVKSRRYIFSEQLSFLRKVTGNRTTTDSLSSAQETQEINGHASQNSATPQSVEGSAQTGPTKRKKISLEERMIKFMEGNEEQEDADKDFFMSMLPSVRTLNEDQKIEFRVQVILSLQSIKSGRYRQSVNPVSHASPFTLPPAQHPYQAYSHSPTPPMAQQYFTPASMNKEPPLPATFGHTHFAPPTSINIQEFQGRQLDPITCQSPAASPDIQASSPASHSTNTDMSYISMYDASD